MDPGPIYIPPDLPGATFPTGDTAPPGVVYFRLYAGAMTLMHVALLLFGIFYIVKGSVGAHAAGHDVEQLIVGVFYAGWGAVMSVPFLIALLGGRKKWVHTLSTVMIAFSMMSLCCLPIAIPLLIEFGKPETRRWYEP